MGNHRAATTVLLKAATTTNPAACTTSNSLTATVEDPGITLIGDMAQVVVVVAVS